MSTGENERRRRRLEHDRAHADQGDFFFVRLVDTRGREIPHPVFVLGKDEDSNDNDDVIVCQCTTANKPNRSDYDVDVQLRNRSYVRTNKIYTVGRKQLEFKIQAPDVDDKKKREIVDQAINAIFHKANP